MRRQTAWDGASGSMAWGGGGPNSAPGAGRLNSNSSHNLAELHNPDVQAHVNSFEDSRVIPHTNPLGGDRRWAPTDASNSGENSNAFAWSSSFLPNTINASDSCCWLLVSDLAPHLSLDTLKMAVTNALEQQQQSGNGASGDFEMHPNMAAQYVLLGFPSTIEANAVANLIANNSLSSGIRLGSTEIISAIEAMTKLQEIKVNFGSMYSRPIYMLLYLLLPEHMRKFCLD